MRLRTTAHVAVVAITLVLGGCSAEFSIGGQSPEKAAVALIETDLADQIGLELTAECDDVDDPGVGSTFGCTATTTDGRVIEFDAVIDREDHINVDSVNVILGDKLPLFEAGAVDALNAQLGATLDASAIDCGDASVILPAGRTMVCALTDPSNGDVYDVTLTITDLDAGLFDIDVADSPRS